MAYYEVLVAFIILVIILVVGYLIGYAHGLTGGWKNGFNDAKKLYYLDPKKDQDEEEQRKIEEVRKANEAPQQITPELLMAFGVENTSQLPKYVREYYKTDTDLKTLIKEEIDVDRD